jgi:hypothetical protein
MAWLSRVNFVSSDTLSFTDINNLGNDIRAWGDNVNGGGYTLSNVVLSASSGTMATVTGGTGAASTLTIRSTSGTGTSDAIVFQTASQSERMRITTSGNVGIGTTTPSYQLQLSTDSAAKPSTNTWTIASDERLKTVLGDYEKGLDEICALRPVRYEYNGLGGMQADGKEHISIVAQEAREVFPECIGTFSGKLREDDEEETELLNYNGHAVTFALINAVRELKARLDALA